MRLPWFKNLRLQLNWLLLCLISILILIALLGSSSSSTLDSVTYAAKTEISSRNRKLKQLTANDFLVLRSFYLGANRTKCFGLCGKETENYVPCYNVSANLLAGFKDGEEFDRHCEVSQDRNQCLVRPPKDYKIPLNWPAGRDVIWSGNLKLSKDQFLSSGSMTKRMMLLEENQISFRSDDGTIVDGVKDYSHLIADMIGLGSDTEFHQAGVRTVLDIDCGFGSFGAHLLSLKVMAVCMAAYEMTGSQVQLALERGLPAVIGDFISRQLPFPSLSYDMVHCAQCGIIWDKKDGLFLIEVDRVLKPGGFFVVTSSTSGQQASSTNPKKGSMSTPIEEFAQRICWNLFAQQEETFIWQKTKDAQCYTSGKKEAIPLCKEEDTPSYYQPLRPCISGSTSKLWKPIQNRSDPLSSAGLQVHGKFGICQYIDTYTSTGVQPDDFMEDLVFQRSLLSYYWSLLAPLIFSDHPKRLALEEPNPPDNMIRNVMDMNSRYGGLNTVLLEAGKSVWVMNVVPIETTNTLPLILDQGFAGVYHNWCDPFPTYSRTYDLLHANGLLSHITSVGCSMIDLLFEMDRILRPEGWIVLTDNLRAIENARLLATQFRWDNRVIDLENGSDQWLFICQKPFTRK